MILPIFVIILPKIGILNIKFFNVTLYYFYPTILDGVAKSPIYCVVLVFQPIKILYMYDFMSEKPIRLVYGTSMELHNGRWAKS